MWSRRRSMAKGARDTRRPGPWRGLAHCKRPRRDAAPVSASAVTAMPPANIQHPTSNNPVMDRAIQLLQRNQPAEALEILQKFQKLFPNNPELLALCGTAAYKSDNVRLAL